VEDPREMDLTQEWGGREAVSSSELVVGVGRAAVTLRSSRKAFVATQAVAGSAQDSSRFSLSGAAVTKAAAAQNS